MMTLNFITFDNEIDSAISEGVSVSILPRCLSSTHQDISAACSIEVIEDNHDLQNPCLPFPETAREESCVSV